MDTNYKRHVINSSVSKKDNDWWSIKVVITWSEGDAEKVQQLVQRLGFVRNPKQSHGANSAVLDGSMTGSQI